MIKYDDVKNLTTEEYFRGNKFSIDAFNKKYSFQDDEGKASETYVQALKRVCDFVASVEKTPESRKYWSERWFDEIVDGWWHPAGSIMQGAGSNRKISLANCTTLSFGLLHDDEEWDNLESIMKNASYSVAKAAAYRQGLGIDFSRLRPRGTTVLNSAKESTGAIHWMQYVDNIAYFIGQKGRIPAFLFSISINHPDVQEFITVKSDYTKIQNANISIQVTDKFYKAVDQDLDWKMEFVIPAVKKGQKVYVDVHSTTMDHQKDERGWYYIATHDRKGEKFERTEKARKLLELIAKNMYANAEPGLQNIDIARKYSNSDALWYPGISYDPRILSTNACSEQYLSRDSLCVLSSINMGRFSTDPAKYSIELQKIGPSINRFLDNVNECELIHKTYATPHQRIAIESLRRTGAGATNIGAWLFNLNMQYGTPEANEKVEKFMQWYNYYLYKSTIELGKEKGNFGLFDSNRIKKSEFIKRMMKAHPDLTFETMRNVTVSSIAPTGSLSLMFRESVMSYGIEPAWDLYFWKRTRISGQYEYYFCVPTAVKKLYEEKGYKIPMESDMIKDDWAGTGGKPIVEHILKYKDEVGINFKPATAISPFDKLDLMSRVMKWVDSSISVTYLLPESTNWQDVYDFILEAHKKEVKSIAAFPDKKMYGIVSFVPFKDLAINLIKEGVSIHSQNFTEDEQVELKKFVNFTEEAIPVATAAPKRPNELDADIYTVTVQGQKFVIAVGLSNGHPYEMFGGSMNGFNFKFANKKGKITKVKRGQYKLTIGEDIEIEDFSLHFTPVEKSLFRLVSLSLRHGVPLKYIVDQLNKAQDLITSLGSAATRVLKKYIREGEEVTGLSCPQCGKNQFQYQDSCPVCVNCGYTKC